MQSSLSLIKYVPMYIFIYLFIENILGRNSQLSRIKCESQKLSNLIAQ